LTMTLKNAGNVPLEDEILQIDLFNKDLGEVVISEEFSISIPLTQFACPHVPMFIQLENRQINDNKLGDRQMLSFYRF